MTGIFTPAYSLSKRTRSDGGPTRKLLDGAPRPSGRRSGGGEDINYTTLVSTHEVGLGQAPAAFS
jgi:hypothetical protein